MTKKVNARTIPKLIEIEVNWLIAARGAFHSSKAHMLFHLDPVFLAG
jgi:hypothetical protein